MIAYSGILTRGFAVFAAMAVMALASVQAHAQNGELAQPSEKVILTIDGKINVHNAEETANFDMPMLEELGAVSITTTTPWFTGPVKFEGVPLAALMEKVGAEGSEILATALNDYKTPVPISDFETYGAILAFKRDGEYMPISDKGPLFIVYPYDSDPELHSQKFYARSAWQVRSFTVR